MAFERSEKSDFDERLRVYPQPRDEADASHRKPLVGLVATRENTGELVSEILRAHRAGHRVVVTHANQPELEAIDFAKELGASIVDPPQSNPDREDLKHVLVIVAKARSAPGLIYGSTADIAIDYPISAARVASSDQYWRGGVPVQREQTEVLIAIPAYDEAGTISEVVTSARQYADTVLVVDDGSTDDTATLAKAAGASVIEHESNEGYGAALKTIFQEAYKRQADHLVIIDADGQHDSSDIPRLVETQRNTDAEIIVGSRFAGDGTTNAPVYRRFGLFIVNLLTNLSFGVVRPRSWISDTQSGFRAYNRQAIESLVEDTEVGDQMSASTDILHHAHHNDFDVREIGTTVDYDVDDASSQHPLSHGLTLVSNILKTIERERPITALGVPGFGSISVGFAFGYWTFSNYLSSGVFPLGLAITSAVFVLAGIFACFTAIILHSLRQHLDD